MSRCVSSLDRRSFLPFVPKIKGVLVSRRIWPMLAKIEMTITNAITLAIAILGAVLGIMNTWRSFDRDRIRLVVSPKWSFCAYPGVPIVEQLCIEITNLSFFPITVAQVAFELRGLQKGKLFVFSPEFLDGGTIPRRMEPRTSFTVLMPQGVENNPNMKYVKCVFVKTECGFVARGTSPALSSHVKELKKV